MRSPEKNLGEFPHFGCSGRKRVKGNYVPTWVWRYPKG